MSDTKTPKRFIVTGEFRPPRKGEWFVWRNGSDLCNGTNCCIQAKMNFESRQFILTPIADNAVVVDGGLVDQLRKGVRKYNDDGSGIIEILDAAHRIDSACPPPEPEDPLESKEFFDSLGDYVSAKGCDVVPAMGRLLSFLRQHAPAIAAAAEKRGVK